MTNDVIVNVSKIVEDVLVEHEDTRGNDDLLYSDVCGRINREFYNLPVSEFFEKRKEYGFPVFGTVDRCRRKIMNDKPYLKPYEADLKRKKSQDSYKEYNKDW